MDSPLERITAAVLVQPAIEVCCALILLARDHTQSELPNGLAEAVRAVANESIF